MKEREKARAVRIYLAQQQALTGLYRRLGLPWLQGSAGSVALCDWIVMFSPFHPVWWRSTNLEFLGASTQSLIFSWVAEWPWASTFCFPVWVFLSVDWEKYHFSWYLWRWRRSSGAFKGFAWHIGYAHHVQHSKSLSRDRQEMAKGTGHLDSRSKSVLFSACSTSLQPTRGSTCSWGKWSPVCDSSRFECWNGSALCLRTFSTSAKWRHFQQDEPGSARWAGINKPRGKPQHMKVRNQWERDPHPASQPGFSQVPQYDQAPSPTSAMIRGFYTCY